MRAHREAGDQAALDQLVRIVADDVAILAGAGLAFVGIDDQVVRPPSDCFGMNDHFSPVGKPRAAAAAQAGRLHLVDDRIAPVLQDRLGAVPVAARARARQAPDRAGRRDW